MSEPSSTDKLWFTRRDGVVRGPFPAAWIRRYILLGRIRMTDELRLGAGDWRPAFRCEELIPEVLRQPLTEDNLARLKQARRVADERGIQDRRAHANPTREQLERRSGDERRRPEAAAERSSRAMRARELCQNPAPEPVIMRRSMRGVLVLGLLAGLILLVSIWP
jgi:hypothetical protein